MRSRVTPLAGLLALFLILTASRCDRVSLQEGEVFNGRLVVSVLSLGSFQPPKLV